jgi:hypothetical protein
LRLTATTALAIAAFLGSQTAMAGPSGNIGDGGIGASANAGNRADAGNSRGPIEVCEWGDDQIHVGSVRSEAAGFRYAYIDLRYWRYRLATGEVWVQTWKRCSRGDERTFDGVAWRLVARPDPEVLADGSYDEVVRQVPVPSPAMSPGGPGFVNLGMWLAVEEQEPISVTARAGDVWATTSAEVVSTTFDLGNGDVVTCDGFGDPIPPTMTDTVEASPLCGYTYRDVAPDDAYTVTITSRWRVRWAGSGGAGGDLGTLDRSTSLTYEVREIQTVGTD